MDEANIELLEKIDLIRERLDVSYQEAKSALDRAEGDLVSALVMLEEEKGQAEGCALIGQLRTLCEKGFETRVRLKKGDATLLEVPASAGLLGLVGMLVSGELAVLGAVGTVTAMLHHCTLEVDGEVEDDQGHLVEIQTEGPES